MLRYCKNCRGYHRAGTKVYREHKEHLGPRTYSSPDVPTGKARKLK